MTSAAGQKIQVLMDTNFGQMLVELWPEIAPITVANFVKLVESGFFVIVCGDANHPEVQGSLGWAKGKGIATTDPAVIAALDPLPRKIGIL